MPNNPTVADVPIPAESLTYQILQGINLEWLNSLSKVETTLSMITSDEIKLPVHVGRVVLNLGTAETRSLSLLPILRQFDLRIAGREDDFVIVFDRADAEWLRGYCHLLSALSEMMMAYDAQELFDVAAHRFFQHTKTPHLFLREQKRVGESPFIDIEDFSDAIAIVHLLRFPIVDRKRMENALKHIEQAISLSRQMWKRILAETDNDREWIPGPKQSGAIPIPITTTMVDNWIRALDEFEQILQGAKLVPFWRGKPTRGINVRRVFLEPRQLDFVLWVQGAAATPYLEEGELTKAGTWQQINAAFGGRLIGFGFWFN